MEIGGIDTSRIQSMFAQLKVAAQNPEKPSFFNIEALTGKSLKVDEPSAFKMDGAGKVDFSRVLKSTLDGVNESQTKADILGKKFALGDDNVSLADVMIAGQKASISFQATIQVRNKVVAAYQDVMSMQV